MSVKNFVLGVGIFIVFVFLVVYGIQAFYPAPEYDKYCNNSIYPKTVPLQKTAYSNCTTTPQFQQQENNCYSENGRPIYTYDDNGCYKSVTCDYCQKTYDEANKFYSRNIFVITLIVGLIAISVGALLFSIEAIGSGLMAGGIGTIFYGSVRNWQNFSAVMKFLLLLLALIVLIWVGFRINKKVNVNKISKKK